MKRFTLLLFTCLNLLVHTNAQNPDKVYGLNYLGIINPDIFSDSLTSELRLTSLDLNTGEVEILTEDPISPDLFLQGVADFDPIQKRYFYPRGGSNEPQIITVDALTGEIIYSPLLTVDANTNNNTVSPITNIAYNWMDDELYGLNHQFNGTNELLYLAKADLITGVVSLLSTEPISESSYITGNSDIDPVNRRYFFVSGNKIFTVDLDTGETIYNPTINFPFTGTQFLVNLTYDWQNDLMYGLHFRGNELRLATIDLQTGDLTILSDEITSNDGFSQGDCDIDPTGNRYFYIRQNALYTVDLTTGDVLSITPISNSNPDAIPLINMTYDDLTQTPVLPITMDMGDLLYKEPGETLELNAWVGDDAVYTWQDGSTDATFLVTDPGDYSVTITKSDFTIHGTVSVQENITATENIADAINFQISPNPVQKVLNYSFDLKETVGGNLQLLDDTGRLLKTIAVEGETGQINMDGFPSGSYFLQYQAGGKKAIRKIIVID